MSIDPIPEKATETMTPRSAAQDQEVNASEAYEVFAEDGGERLGESAAVQQRGKDATEGKPFVRLRRSRLWSPPLAIP